MADPFSLYIFFLQRPRKLKNVSDVTYTHPKPDFSASPGTLFINTLRPRQDDRYFPDDILKCIFLNESV